MSRALSQGLGLAALTPVLAPGYGSDQAALAATQAAPGPRAGPRTHTVASLSADRIPYHRELYRAD